jgi:predicted DNA-binding antitoxin AbrB/MazE fold protein
MHQHFEVVYENGVLRPLEPLPPELQENQHLTITIATPDTLEARLDAICIAAAKRNADPTVSLEEVRRILARCEPTADRSCFSDKASYSLRPREPTTDRADRCRSRLFLG